VTAAIAAPFLSMRMHVAFPSSIVHDASTIYRNRSTVKGTANHLAWP
jgi:hypothetical protein